MIKLIYEPDEEVREFTVDKVEITASEDGHIQDYLKAFSVYLRACGFVDGTIEKALPTLEL